MTNLPLVWITLVLAGSVLVPTLPLTHAQFTGLVCITASTTATGCPTSAPMLGPFTTGETFSIGVFIQGSDTMAGYDIYVKSNPSVLNPTAAALGNLVASPTFTVICVDGVSKTGTCTAGSANGPGVVEVSTIESSGGNECGGIAPCSGMAFTVTYYVAGSSPDTSLTFPISGDCGNSSVSSPANVCVLVDDTFGTTLSENTQAASVNPIAGFTFSPSLPQAGQPVTFTPSTNFGTSPYSYYWTFGDGVSSNVTSPTHTYSYSGTFNVTMIVTDSSSPPMSRTVVGRITVQPPDFSISLSPSTIGPVAPNEPGYSNIAITGISLFTGIVMFSLAPSPGLRVSLSSNNITLNAATRVSNATISLSAQSPGSYAVAIGASSNGLRHDATVSVNVGDFKISGPTLVNMLPGIANATSQLRVSPFFAFNGTVSLSWSSESGLNATISPSTITESGVAALTLSGVAGSYVLTVTGSSPGFPSRGLFVTVNIGVDFKLSTTQIPNPVIASDSALSTINVTSIHGFTGTVNLEFIPSPGLIVSLSTTSVSVAPNRPGIAILTVSAATNGTYYLTVVATSQGLAAQTSRLSLVVVRDPPPHFIRVGQPLNQGSSIGNTIASLSRYWFVISILAVISVVFSITKSRKR